MLLFLIPVDSENICQDYEILLSELRKYNPELLDKKRILVVTKCDLLPEEELAKLKNLPNDLPVVFVSSHAQKNLLKLKDMIWSALQD